MIFSATLDFIGNFTRAPFKAVRARPAVELLVSKRTWPFLAIKTQRLTEPFPFPIRTSWGFFVIGVWGNTEIHVFASLRKIPLRNLRVDSRCFAEIRPLCNANKPILPNLKREAFTFKVSEQRREKDLVNFSFWGDCNIVLKKLRKKHQGTEALISKF